MHTHKIQDVTDKLIEMMDYFKKLAVRTKNSTFVTNMNFVKICISSSVQPVMSFSLSFLNKVVTAHTLRLWFVN